MAKCILTFKKKIIGEYPITGDSITIGRNQDNTIVIDNLAVSGYHAKIDKVGDDFIITDLQSTNGTFINRQKIVSHKLKHGDNIMIGKHIILFVAPEKAKAPEKEKEADFEKTVILDSARQKDLLAGDRKAATEPEKIGVVNFIDNSGLGEIELKKKLTKIGKSDTCDIKLSGMLIGQTAATISKRPSGYAITFIGGMSKLKVNGKVVKGSVPLKDFDTIEIGGYKFQFYEKEVK